MKGSEGISNNFEENKLRIEIPTMNTNLNGIFKAKKLVKATEGITDSAINGGKFRAKELVKVLLEDDTRVIKLPKFSEEQIERIINTSPINNIAEKELKKIIEGLSNKEIIIKSRKSKWSEANKNGRLPSIEELIIISILKNKRINPKNNDMLSYELSEALQTNWYWSNVEYSDSTAWVVYMNYSHTGSVNKNHYGGVIYIQKT